MIGGLAWKATYFVKNSFRMLMYVYIHCASSLVFAAYLIFPRKPTRLMWKATYFVKDLFVYGIFILLFPTVVLAQQAINIPVNRIISLAPNITELLYAAGAGHKVVGVSAFSNYPVVAKKLPVVATSTGLDLERIAALKPDLAVAWQGGNPQQELHELTMLNVPVYVAKVNSIEAIALTLEHLGQLAGTSKVANKYAAQLMASYQQIKQKNKNQVKLRVFYQIAQRPLMTLNGETIENQLITTCGGENIFANTLSNAPMVNLAAVLAKQPQVIIISQSVGNKAKLLKFWQKYPQIPAVKAHNVFFVNSDWVDRAGPRIIKGLNQVCQKMAQARKNLKLTTNRRLQ